MAGSVCWTGLRSTVPGEGNVSDPEGLPSGGHRQKSPSASGYMPIRRFYRQDALVVLSSLPAKNRWCNGTVVIY